MDALLAILIAKALDPILIVIALITAAFCQGWSRVPFLAIIPALLVEVILSANQVSSRNHLMMFALGYVASLLWLSVSFKILKWWRARRNSQETN